MEFKVKKKNKYLCREEPSNQIIYNNIIDGE